MLRGGFNRLPEINLSLPGREGKLSLSFFVPLLVGVAAVQVSLLPHLTIVGVRPDLMLLVVISWSLLRGTGEGLLWAFVGGLCLDFLSGAPFGVSTLALLIVSFLASLGEVRIYGTHIILPLSTIFLATIVYDFIFLLLLQVLGRPVPWVESAISIILPSTFLNVFLMLPVYWAIRWLDVKTGRERIGW
jgi:rod shape-determining protein MreD